MTPSATGGRSPPKSRGLSSTRLLLLLLLLLLVLLQQRRRQRRASAAEPAAVPQLPQLPLRSSEVEEE